MKNLRKFTALFAAALTLCLFASCSNSAGGGGNNTAPQETTPSPAPVPNPVIYTITFNANDGSENPATATQTFTAGTPKALKSIATLGFYKNGYNFAGWGTTANATQASYANATSYTATSNATLYALWSEIPIYSVNIPENANGSVTATPVAGPAGTEIKLSSTSNEGYQPPFYTVTGADGTILISGRRMEKFTMPAQDVTVTANFTAINYNINKVVSENGDVSISSPTYVGSVPQPTATVGATVNLFIQPDDGYRLETLNVIDEDGIPIQVVVDATWMKCMTFTMPAKNVTVTATFIAIYGVNVVSTKGTVTADKESAAQGEIVTLTLSPMGGCQLTLFSVVDSDGSDVPVSGSGNNRIFTMPAKAVTVTATFTFKPSTYMTFGSWPQTIKAENVTVYQGDEYKKKVGAFTYHKGSDGNWYVEVEENAYSSGTKYSDGTRVAQKESVPSFASYKWFKVEPIKWRVLTTDYNGTGKKLLLAENLLVNCSYYDYRESSRTVDGSTVCANNYKHSRIRAFLNGLSYPIKRFANSEQTVCNDFLNKGFLQTAFTSAELARIVDTSVDNSVRSTFPDNYDSLDDLSKQNLGNGINAYASDTPVIDKIFLLSVQEQTKNEYGFDSYRAGSSDIALVRQPTDYAKASGACCIEGQVRWWLRSPRPRDSYAAFGAGEYVTCDYAGVVPVLCIQ